MIPFPSLINFLPVRQIVYAVIACVLAWAAWSTADWLYDAGYDAARLEYQDESLQAANEAVTKARALWEESAAAAEKHFTNERGITESINDVKRKIPEAVEGTGCRDVGPGVLGVFNDAVDAANNSGENSAASP